MKTAKEIREEFRDDGPCDVCGSMAHLIHEIARGQHREKAKTTRYATLRLCTLCHQEIHDWDNMTSREWILKQLAYLGCARPNDLKLTAFNELKGRGPQDITFIDLLPYLEVKDDA